MPSLTKECLAAWRLAWISQWLQAVYSQKVVSAPQCTMGFSGSLVS